LGGHNCPGLTLHVSVGGVLSMLSVTLTLAEFPARSVAVPLTTCPKPSVVTITGSLTEAIPESESAATNVTATSVLFQPLVLGGGFREIVMVGGVLSSRMVALFTPSTLPALSTAEKVSTVVPSVEMTIVTDAPVTTVLGIACAPLPL